MRGSYYNSRTIKTGDDFKDVAGLRWIYREGTKIWTTSVDAPSFEELSARDPNLADKFKPVELHGDKLHFASLKPDEMAELVAAN